jgi:hypothetical protein
MGKLFVFLICLLVVSSAAGISWPNDQFLPSFASPAETLLVMNVGGNVSGNERLLFTSLKGLVNKTKPRIWSYNNDEEGKYGWLDSLRMRHADVADNWSLLTKYRSSIAGMVVIDSIVPDEINLATTVAALRGGVVAPASLAARLAGAPYNLPILDDFRGKFATKLDVYNYEYANYWTQTTRRALVSLPPSITGNCRDFASAVGTAVVWLDPRTPAEKTVLDKFLSGMPGGNGVVMGWWPDEASGVAEASAYGLSTCASDWSENLTVWGGTSRIVAVKPVPPLPKLEKKMYVTLIMSNGDNLQYVEHKMKNMWATANRGAIPLGWTISPATLDAMPAALDYYYRTATANDCFVSGPSGIGYTYPNYWANAPWLNAFVKITDSYAKRAGLRVVTVWNTITGGISAATGNAFAASAPSLLGITGMKAGGDITIYGNRLPSQNLNATYCYSEATLISEITNATSTWSGTAPLFVSIQGNPWQASYQDFVNAVAHFKSNANMVFVRPDSYFQLMRQSYGLPVDTPVTATLQRSRRATSGPLLEYSPLSRTVRISGDALSGATAVTVYDAKGKRIRRVCDAKAVSLSGLPVGTYVAELTTGSRQMRVRCVVMSGPNGK